MPRVTVRDTELHYEEQGSGPEAVVFAHGLLLSGRQFDGRVAALRGDYRCITYDARGHGRTGRWWWRTTCRRATPRCW